jgi:pimeloyl-ACP methyl ester carboxylesterase
MRDRVLTIHGIATKGQWQEELKTAYAPHFECTSIKYPQYRRFGAMKLLLDPVVLLVAAAIVGAFRFFAAPGFGGLPWAGTLLVVAILFIAYLATYVRRTFAFNSVLRQASPYAQAVHQDRTHLIAHSFGTYLAARGLRNRSDFRLGRIVLVGCVLPPKFPWARLQAGGGRVEKFLAVRNEVGGQDIVVYAAWAMSWLIHGLGMAGLLGFKGSDVPIHNLDHPDDSCQACSTVEARIHNVFSDTLGHSDTFVGSGYAETYWLPFLWKVDPREYQEFIKYCNAAAGLERAWSESARAKGHVDPRLLKVEAALRACVWRWSKGQFSTYVAAEVMSRFPGTANELQDSVSLAIRGTWLNVMQALEAHQARATRASQKLPHDPTQDEAIAWLNPHLAVHKAVELLP